MSVELQKHCRISANFIDGTGKYQMELGQKNMEGGCSSVAILFFAEKSMNNTDHISFT
jgi:hypothetical protein